MKNPVIAVELLISEVNLLKADYPQLASDEELLADTLEGETDLNALVDKLVSLVKEHDAMAESIAARIGQLRERQTRMTMRMNFYRGLIYKLLTKTGVKSVNAVEGKVSVVNAPDKVIITDEAAIPDELMRVKKEPDKAAIKRALQDGKYVSGATLSNGGTTLQLR